MDTAIRATATAGQRIRTDVSATLFLSAPEEYEGGELSVEDTYGVHTVKLPAGHMVLYPATSLHRVVPVVRGARLASFFWVQSMIRSDGDRTLLYDLDTAIQRLAIEAPGNAAEVRPGFTTTCCAVGRRCKPGDLRLLHRHELPVT